MASRKSSRKSLSPQRYGFDLSPEDEDSEFEEEEYQVEVSAEDSSSRSDEDTSAELPLAAGDCAAIEWQFVTVGADNRPAVTFSGNPGMQNGVDTSDWTLIDYMRHFLPDSLFENITKWTNSCIVIKNAELQCLGEDIFPWKEVSTQEMKTMLGLTFFMSIIQKPSINSYWETNSMMITPHFGQCMGRDRYSFILRYLRFSDPYEVDKSVKSTRLQDFFSEMFRLCSTFVADQELSLDESLLLFKGRLLFKMFIRIKRARFGIKIFYLCDPHGYIHFVPMYTTELPRTWKLKNPVLKACLRARSLWFTSSAKSGCWTKGTLSIWTTSMTV